MGRLGIVDSDHARPPMAPLSEPARARAEEILAGSEIG
jgi:dihydrodipicolinate synthase/N-acetylneuraminate lyase